MGSSKSKVANDTPMAENKDGGFDDEESPIAKRCCTDIFCWLIWVCSILFWIYIVIQGLAKGSPNK